MSAGLLAFGGPADGELLFDAGPELRYPVRPSALVGWHSDPPVVEPDPVVVHPYRRERFRFAVPVANWLPVSSTHVLWDRSVYLTPGYPPGRVIDTVAGLVAMTLALHSR